MARSANAANGKRHATRQSLNGAIKSICDVMRRSNCAGAMQYVPELTWILFLRPTAGATWRQGRHTQPCNYMSARLQRRNFHDFARAFNAARMPSATAMPGGRPLTAAAASLSL